MSAMSASIFDFQPKLYSTMVYCDSQLLHADLHFANLRPRFSTHAFVNTDVLGCRDFVETIRRANNGQLLASFDPRSKRMGARVLVPTGSSLPGTHLRSFAILTSFLAMNFSYFLT